MRFKYYIVVGDALRYVLAPVHLQISTLPTTDTCVIYHYQKAESSYKMSQWLTDDAFKLMRGLYSRVVSTKCTISSLQIIHDAPHGEILFHESTKTDTLDIAMSKKTYLKIFAEAHAVFEKLGYKFVLQLLTGTELWALYYATTSMLLTTNEHLTIWRLHREAVFELHDRGEEIIKKEFDYVTFLAASKLKRVNKSSMLFHWLRFLMVPLFETLDAVKILIQRLLRSLEVHFANYCAGYTFQWMIRLLHASQKRELFEYAGLQIREICRSHLSDITIWETYSVWLTADSDTFTVDLFNRDALQWTKHSVFVKELQYGPQMSRVDDVVLEDLDWLVKVECAYMSPYESLYKATNDKNAIRHRIHLLMKPDVEVSDARHDASTERTLSAMKRLHNIYTTLSKYHRDLNDELEDVAK